MQFHSLKKPFAILVVLILVALGITIFQLPSAPHSRFSTAYSESELPQAAPTELPEKTVEVAGTIYAFDIRTDKTMIALATSKGVIIYDMASFEVVTELFFEKGAQAVAFSPDGTKLAVLQKQTLSFDYGYIYVTIFETTNWQALNAYQNDFPNYLYAVPNLIKWNPDSIRLAFITPDKGMIVWNHETGEIIESLAISYTFGGFDWSSDGSRLIFGESSYGLRRWRVDTDDWVRLYDTESQSASVMEWSPNGKYIASGHYGGTVCIWNVSNNQCEGYIRAHVSSVDGLAWSPDSKFIATSSGAIRIWDLKNGEEKSAFGYDSEIHYTQLAWVSEQVTATLENSYTQNISPTVKFWDIETGDVQLAFRGWQNLKSFGSDGVSLRVDDIQISEKETLIRTSLLFDYENLSALDWDVKLRDNTGKTYPLTRLNDGGFDSNIYHVYKTTPLHEGKTFTLEIKSANGLKLVRDVSNDYGFLYFDPTQLKLGESVELNQEVYLSDFQFYLTEAEKLSENEIRFKFFTGYNLESVWFDNPLIVENTVSVDGKGRFSSTLTLSKIPKDVIELAVQKVYYKAQGPWALEFEVLDSMFVK